MSPIASAIVVLMISCFTLAQRGSYAGKKPVGYPQIVASTTESSLGDRFGEEASTTTQKLPLEALGDRELINRLSKLPVDKQPFWFLNWQALEDNRKNPQTYQPNPNSFVVESTNQALPSNQVSSFLKNQAAVTNLPTRNNIASNNVSNGKVPATNLPNAQFASLGNTVTIASTGNDGRIAPNGQNFPERNQGQIAQTNNGQISSVSNDKQRNIIKQRN